jgi:hypothetical protein
MADTSKTDDEKTTGPESDPAPSSAQNPDDTQPHGGEHSPDEAKGGASDSDGKNG